MQQRFPLFVAEDKPLQITSKMLLHTKLEVPSEDSQVMQRQRGQPTVKTDL